MQGGIMMSVKVHEPRRGKWKIPVIIAVILAAACLIGAGIVMKDSGGVSVPNGSVKINVAEGAGITVTPDAGY